MLSHWHSQGGIDISAGHCNLTAVALLQRLDRIVLAAGCGKTTLLSILSGSVSSLSRSSRVYGHITLDGATRKAWASRLVAYVPQFDFLLPTLTVAETLRYSALLRLPKDTEGAEVQVRSSSLTRGRLGLIFVIVLGPVQGHSFHVESVSN